MSENRRGQKGKDSLIGPVKSPLLSSFLANVENTNVVLMLICCAR